MSMPGLWAECQAVCLARNARIADRSESSGGRPVARRVAQVEASGRGLGPASRATRDGEAARLFHEEGVVQEAQALGRDRRPRPLGARLRAVGEVEDLEQGDGTERIWKR